MFLAFLYGWVSGFHVLKSYYERLMSENTEPPTKLHVGSWNVAGLRGEAGEGKMENIRNHRVLFDIFALQETHLPLQAARRQNDEWLFIDADRYFHWRFDREPVRGNQAGGGLLVYFSERLIQEQLAGVRQLPDLPPSVIRHPRNRGRNKKAGLQYMHFHIKNPIQFHLVVIYNSTGCRNDLVILFQYFLQDLQLRNVMFIGDLNANHRINEAFRTMLIDIDNSLLFHIEGDTCYKDPNNPSQTDHIISCFGQSPSPPLFVLDQCILAGKCPGFDHYLIGGILVQIPKVTQWRNSRIVQPTWERGVTEQNIESWFKERIARGTCVLVTYIKVLEPTNVEHFSTDSLKVYIGSNEPNTVICVGRADDNLELVLLLDEMEQRFQSVSATRPGIISRRCSLIHVEGKRGAGEFLGRVLNQQSGCLTENFELCASRYYISIDSPQKYCLILPNKADLLSHDISARKPTVEIVGEKRKQQFQAPPNLKMNRQAVHGTKIPKCPYPSCLVPVVEENRETHALVVHLRYVCNEKKCEGFKFKHRKQQHKCKECGGSSGVYYSQTNLEKHMKEKHKKELRAEKFSCLKCSKSCNTEEEFRSHLESCYWRKPFECEKCKQLYQHKSWYLKHKTRCTGVKPCAVCDLCGKEYKREDSYRTHISWCGGEKPYKCEKCGKEYINERSYHSHISRCGREKPYKCEKCGKEYTNERSYQTHISWCGGNKPHQCSKCGKGFSYERSCKKHISLCKDDKPYRCSNCKKGYVMKGSYQNHISWCTGSKPYWCSKCEKGYINERSYQNHISWCGSDKPYQCKKCGKGYVNERSYQTHISWCGGRKPYQCEMCGKEYVNEKSWQTHVSKLCKRS